VSTGPDDHDLERTRLLHDRARQRDDRDERRARRAVKAEADAARVRAVHAELLQRAPESRMEPRLEPVRAVCELLGDPQRAYPVIHLTGTNGKTSTARMVERLLREHNLRTGRFTSPHLHSVTERISVDGRPLPDAVFADTWEEVAPLAAMVDGRLVADGEPPLTYFELLTCMAFAAFADTPVDVAVVEVGLGGTWDATNVADATVAVVLPISLDHTEMMGDSVAAIAEEKSGIFTEGGYVVMADQPVEAAEVLLRRAVESGSTVSREGPEFGVVHRSVALGGQQVTVQGVAGEYVDLFLPLHGPHQAQNLAVAIATVEAFLGNGNQRLDTEIVHAAVAGMTSPGRLELVRPSPAVVLDAAHNVGGVEALVRSLDEAFAFRHLVGVVGVLRDKDAENILAVLEPVLDDIVVTRSTSPRAVPVDELAELAVDVFGEDRVQVVERLDDAIVAAIGTAEAAVAHEEGHGAGVLVTGSVTVVGEARMLLRAPAVDADQGLDQEQEELS
jgi:dihydrofolate synthase/folylpolyglutamate synthase